MRVSSITTAMVPEWAEPRTTAYLAHPVASLAACSAAGVLLALTHEYESLFPLAIVAIAAFLAISSRTKRRWFACALGFAFGVACYGAALPWLFNLVDRGQAPLVAALLPALLIIALGLPTAVVGVCVAGPEKSRAARLVLLAPLAWTLFDWLRHQGDVAFPWLSVGYSQVSMSPLAGYAPVGGILLVGFVTVLLAALTVIGLLYPNLRRSALAAAVALFVLGAVLHQIAWTMPSGEPLRIAALQGNVGAADKFDASTLSRTLARYESLIRSSDADVVLLPESALPLPVNALGGYLRALERHARRSGVDVLLGAFEIDNAQRYSSGINFGPSGTQVYRKRHLVPFGDFVPGGAALLPLYAAVQRVPFADTSRGDSQQPLAVLNGGRVAIAICYDDVFGEHMRADAAGAGWIANLSNDSWGDSRAMQRQHARVAQARSLEFGRPSMRVADTGRSGLIDERGRWVDSLPLNEVGALEAQLVPRTGATLYARWGDRAALSVCAIALLIAAGHISHRSEPST